jgi:hypothetical protein
MENSKALLTALEEAKFRLSEAHNYYYRNLILYGPNLFKEDGSILLRKKDGSQKRYEGREFILTTLKYYEAKDDSFYYRKCARLKKVLDDYDARFSIKKILPMKTV